MQAVYRRRNSVPSRRYLGRQVADTMIKAKIPILLTWMRREPARCPSPASTSTGFSPANASCVCRSLTQQRFDMTGAQRQCLHLDTVMGQGITDGVRQRCAGGHDTAFTGAFDA